jgi:hypothetical protein
MHRIVRLLRTSRVLPTPHAKCELPGCSKSVPSLTSIVIDGGVSQTSVTELDLAVAIE